MDRRLSLGPDPLATVTLGGVALVVAAALLASTSIDGGGIGPVELTAALTPLFVFVAYVTWVSTRSTPSADPMEAAAVAIMLSEVDDPLGASDDELSRAAAELLGAISRLERETASARLAAALQARRSAVSPQASRPASPPSG